MGRRSFGEAAPPWSHAQNRAVEAQSRMAARACSKPLATWIMVMQAAAFRRPLASSLPTFEQAAAVVVNAR